MRIYNRALGAADIQALYLLPVTAVEGGPRAGLSAPRVVPNPAAGTSPVGFAIPAAAAVDLVLCDVLGREVRVLARGPLGAGSYSRS